MSKNYYNGEGFWNEKNTPTDEEIIDKAEFKLGINSLMNTLSFWEKVMVEHYTIKKYSLIPLENVKFPIYQALI